MFGDVLRIIADTATPIPGGVDTFSGFFNYPAISGKAMFFSASDRFEPFQFGVYLDINGRQSVIADLNTAVPGEVAFSGFDADDTIGEGIYLNSGSLLSVVADTNTPVPGAWCTLPVGGRSYGQEFDSILGEIRWRSGLFVSEKGVLRVDR